MKRVCVDLVTCALWSPRIRGTDWVRTHTNTFQGDTTTRKRRLRARVRRLLTQRCHTRAARHSTDRHSSARMLTKRATGAQSTSSRPARLLLDWDALHTSAAATRHTAPRVRRTVRLSRPLATDADPTAILTALLCAQLLPLLSHLGRVRVKG